jgi:hypothetical protein
MVKIVSTIFRTGAAAVFKTIVKNNKGYSIKHPS